MNVNFLAARVPLVKHFQLSLGKITSLPYPSAARFTSYEVVVNNLKDFYTALLAHASNGHCLLKGQCKKPLINESRADNTNAHSPTDFILFDLDGIAGLNPEQFMARIGLDEISYIVQYSASSGVKPEKGLSCHIFVMLDQPVTPATLKLWLVKLNFDHFKEHIVLNRQNESLHWPIDITTCQNDKLIYIAPPICSPPEIDTFNQPRIQLIQRAKPTFSFLANFIPIDQKVIELLKNGLREIKGLPKLHKEKIDTKHGNTEYYPKPDIARLTGIKEGEEFTHLNLNDGDSWGYYHFTKGPYFLYNFKGEPTYKLQELLPDYWNTLEKAKDARIKEKQSINSSRTVLALRDITTALYHNGWYEAKTDTLELYQSPSKDQLHDFLDQQDIPKPKSIPYWHCSYNPCSKYAHRIDLATHTLNWFIPSEYMRQLTFAPTVNIPTNINVLLRNVFGSDPGLIDHFINWVACAYRFRLPNGTAWIAQGVQGTGKGMLVRSVLEPLFGQTNVAYKRMTELHDKFNEFIQGSLICFIDEIAIGEDRHHDSIMADLKQQITEPTITIRKMHTAAKQVRNHANWIFSTNNKQPIKIEEGDRRYNVGEFCEVKLVDRVGNTHTFAAAIAAELSQFHAYLMTYTADCIKASTVYHNESRKEMIESGMITADVVSKAIRNGDLPQLYEWIDNPTNVADHVRFAVINQYRDLVHDLILTRRDHLFREELHTIFAATCGNISRESAKFTQFLKHRDIVLKPMFRNNKSFRGLPVKWFADDVWLKDVQAELSLGKVAPMLKKASPKEDVKDGKA